MEISSPSSPCPFNWLPLERQVDIFSFLGGLHGVLRLVSSNWKRVLDSFFPETSKTTSVVSLLLQPIPSAFEFLLQEYSHTKLLTKHKKQPITSQTLSFAIKNNISGPTFFKTIAAFPQVLNLDHVVLLVEKERLDILETLKENWPFPRTLSFYDKLVVRVLGIGSNKVVEWFEINHLLFAPPSQEPNRKLDQYFLGAYNISSLEAFERCYKASERHFIDSIASLSVSEWISFFEKNTPPQVLTTVLENDHRQYLENLVKREQKKFSAVFSKCQVCEDWGSYGYQQFVKDFEKLLSFSLGTKNFLKLLVSFFQGFDQVCNAECVDFILNYVLSLEQKQIKIKKNFFLPFNMSLTPFTDEYLSVLTSSSIRVQIFLKKQTFIERLVLSNKIDNFFQEPKFKPHLDSCFGTLADVCFKTNSFPTIQSFPPQFASDLFSYCLSHTYFYNNITGLLTIQSAVIKKYFPKFFLRQDKPIDFGDQTTSAFICLLRFVYKHDSLFSFLASGFLPLTCPKTKIIIDWLFTLEKRLSQKDMYRSVKEIYVTKFVSVPVLKETIQAFESFNKQVQFHFSNPVHSSQYCYSVDTIQEFSKFFQTNFPHAVLDKPFTFYPTTPLSLDMITVLLTLPYKKEAEDFQPIFECLLKENSLDRFFEFWELWLNHLKPTKDRKEFLVRNTWVSCLSCMNSNCSLAVCNQLETIEKQLFPVHKNVSPVTFVLRQDLKYLDTITYQNLKQLFVNDSSSSPNEEKKRRRAKVKNTRDHKKKRVFNVKYGK